MHAVSVTGAWVYWMDNASDKGSLMYSDYKFAHKSRILYMLSVTDGGTHNKSHASEPVTFNRAVILSDWLSSHTLTRQKQTSHDSEHR